MNVKLFSDIYLNTLENTFKMYIPIPSQAPFTCRNMLPPENM